MADGLDLIVNRRSVSPRWLGAPIPTPEELQILVRAAASAPDHKALRPYRFVLIPDHKRTELADAFREAKRERDPGASAEELERAAAKAFNGPLLLAVVLRVVRDHPRVSATDQMLTAGAAIENLLLAAEGLSYAGCLRSGISATSRRVREALRLGEREDLAAFIMLGTPLKRPEPRKSVDVGDLLSSWDD